MGNNVYYKDQPSVRCKTIQEVSTGWFWTQLSYLPDGLAPLGWWRHVIPNLY